MPATPEDDEITEPAWTQETLRESEGRFHALAKASNDVVYRMGPDWREMRRLDGAGLLIDAQAPSTDWVQIHIPPDEWPRVRDAVERAIRAKALFELEHRVLRMDGTVGWMHSRAVPLLDSAGEIVEWFGAASDVTTRVEADQKFTRLFQASPAPFLVVAPDTPRFTIREVNDAYLAATMTTRERIVGRGIFEAFPDNPDDANADGVSNLRASLQRALKTRGPDAMQDQKYDIARPDGGFEERWWSPVNSPVLDDGGEVEAIIHNATDVTDKRRSEAALRASESAALVNAQRVQLALAAGAIIGTWLWDLPTDRFTVDEAFARTFGLDPALGREGIPLAQIVATVHPDDQAGLTDAIDEAIARGGAYAHQYRVRRADGRYYWIEANGRVDHGPDGAPLSFPGVLIDVEERRAVEAERDRAAAALRALNETLEQRVAERTAELMQAEEKLRQSQKMEAVGQLTGGLAHDFNNLLTGMMGNLEMLQGRVARGRLEDVDRFIIAAQGAGRRAASLTQRLLAFSRRQTLDPRPTDVNRLIAGIEDLLRRTVGGAAQIEVVGAAGLWLANIDAGQLENALLNLCINARDAMPEGGRITIETANKWLDERTGRERDLPPGQYLSICVTDTGSGMSAETIARAFEPFYTTKPIGQGTGLGLSMIYGFARQSGGQVRIYSEVGHGTTVCVYLPRHVGDAGPVDAVETVRGIESATGQTVLVVDDEPTIRHLIDEVLDEAGFTVINAADGASGLRVIESGARIELLITDVGLPNGMNGRQVADAARALRPGLKVLFITGYAENAAVGNGHLEHGMELLTKPFSMDALAAKVGDMMKLNHSVQERSPRVDGADLL